MAPQASSDVRERNRLSSPYWDNTLVGDKTGARHGPVLGSFAPLLETKGASEQVRKGK